MSLEFVCLCELSIRGVVSIFSKLQVVELRSWSPAFGRSQWHLFRILLSGHDRPVEPGSLRDSIVLIGA